MTSSFNATKRTLRRTGAAATVVAERTANERRSIRHPLAALAAVATIVPMLTSPVAAAAAAPTPTAVDAIFEFDQLESLGALISGGDRLGVTYTNAVGANAIGANTIKASTNVVAMVNTVDGPQVLELDSPTPELLSEALFALDGVIAAEVDGASYLTGTGAPYGHLQTHLSSIRHQPGRSANGAVVAVLDSGVEAHPDLPPMTGGYNTVDENTNTTAVTEHGTMVAGSMTAMSNNGVGIDATVNGITVMPIRVCKTDGCSFGDVAEGIIWATNNGADVINLSLGGNHSSVTEAAINYANDHNVLVVASAGNNGAAGNPTIYPAALPGVIGVGAYGNDAPTNWASNGSWVEISAPGEAVATLSTGGNYVLGKGTSFSAPQVAGAAALLRSIVPTATASQIRAALVATSRDINGPGWDAHTGAGSLDIGAAVAWADAHQTQFGANMAAGSIGAAASIAALVQANDYRPSDAMTLRLYRAFLGREPDVPGAQYWIGETRKGADLATLVYNFTNSSEYRGLYGANVSNQRFLEVLYRNVFEREPDAAGVNYWLGQVNAGVSRTDVVYSVAAAAEFTNRYSYGT